MYQIRESGAFKNLVDAATGIDYIETGENISRAVRDYKSSNLAYSSIAKAASDLVMIFPVMCPDTISISTAAMVSKAIERKAVSLLQLVLSAANVQTVDNAFEYLKKFHSNIKSGGDVDDYIYAINKIATDKNFFRDVMVTREGANINGFDIHVSTEATQKMLDFLKSDNFVLPESVNDRRISDFKITESAFGYDIKIRTINEYDLGNPPDRDDPKYSNAFDPNTKKYTSKEDRDKMFSSDREDYKFAMGVAKDKLDMAGKMVGMDKDVAAMFKSQLVDSDVKKANELVPSLMIVRFTNAQTGMSTTFVAGVKAKLISVKSSEMVSKIIGKNSNSNVFLNFIRATTGEISLVNDFFLGLNNAKVDILSKKNKGSKSDLWKILERRANWAKTKSAVGKAGISRIATLVVSNFEVEELKKYDNIDLLNPSTAKKLMDGYGLLCLVIVDETTEVAKFMFDDGENRFEDLSFDSLERDNGDGNYRKIVNLISKIK